MKKIKELLKSMNSYGWSNDDLRLARVRRNRKAKRKTTKIKIKDIDYGWD